MYPSAVDYRAPTTQDEALAVLAELGDDAKVLAGGQSLIPLLKLRFASPGVLVDVNGVDGLDQLHEVDGRLCVGALVRHRDIVDSALVRQRYPTMAEAAPLVSDPLVRNRGTLAGSLAHADPAGDWSTVMLAMDAQVRAESATAGREIPVDEFLEGPFTTTLDPTELVAEVAIPRPRGQVGGAYLKLERKVGDFATVGVAVHLELSGGVVDRAGIALTAVGPRSVPARDAERLLAGAEPSAALFDEAADLAARAAEPTTDLRGSAEYKRHVVRVFTRRGLDRALAGARTQTGE
ncbi:MAG: FAD binding domain-containing protein [Actinomycetes bacterium]